MGELKPLPLLVPLWFIGATIIALGLIVEHRYISAGVMAGLIILFGIYLTANKYDLGSD